MKIRYNQLILSNTHQLSEWQDNSLDPGPLLEDARPSGIMSIKLSGYYLSEPIPWTDWPAGHKFEGVTYEILLFVNNMECVRLSSESEQCLADLLFQKEDPKDHYELLDDDTLLLIVNPKSTYSKERHFTILSPETLLNENMVEYTFRPLTQQADRQILWLISENSYL